MASSFRRNIKFPDVVRLSKYLGTRFFLHQVKNMKKRKILENEVILMRNRSQLENNDDDNDGVHFHHRYNIENGGLGLMLQTYLENVRLDIS